MDEGGALKHRAVLEPMHAAIWDANLFPARKVINGLLAVAALSVALLGVAELVARSSAPRSLQDGEPSPNGSWTCGLTDETVGMLTVNGWQYALTTGGRPPVAGSLAPVGGRTPKNNMALVHVESGPLKDTFGIRLGYYDEKSEPRHLTFSMGPGQGISCSSM